MPGSRRGASSRPISRPTPTPTKAPAPAPTTASKSSVPAKPTTAANQQPAPVVVQGPGMLATMGSSMAGAMAGSVMGHAIVGGVSSLFGSSDNNNETAASQQPPSMMGDQDIKYQQTSTENFCNPLYKSFMTCLEKNQNDITTCQWVYDSFLECKKNPNGPNYY